MPYQVTEELFPVPTTVDNVPPAPDTVTPARAGIFARIFGSNGPLRQEESNITNPRRSVGPDAVPAPPSEGQQLLQLQINATAAEQRTIIVRIEAEIAGLDSRRATAAAALVQSHQRANDLERLGESAGIIGASLSPGPPSERCSPRRSPSPPSKVAALLQLFQQQLQQALDQRREDRRETAAREDSLEAQRREDRRETAERKARLEARVIQSPDSV
jgi:hypothetical protein